MKNRHGDKKKRLFGLDFILRIVIEIKVNMKELTSQFYKHKE